MKLEELSRGAMVYVSRVWVLKPTALGALVPGTEKEHQRWKENSGAVVNWSPLWTLFRGREPCQLCHMLLRGQNHDDKEPTIGVISMEVIDNRSVSQNV